MIEDGAMIIDGKIQPMEGDVKIGRNVYFQNFVSIKRAFGKDKATDIGDNTYVCSFSNIGHDVKIGKNCYLAPHSIICGYAQLGDYVYVGANSVIIQEITIGSFVKIRAGSVVDRDIPDNTYWGKDGKCYPNTYKNDKDEEEKNDL